MNSATILNGLTTEQYNRTVPEHLQLDSEEDFELNEIFKEVQEH